MRRLIAIVAVGAALVTAGAGLTACSGPTASQGYIENIDYEPASSYSLGSMSPQSCYSWGGTPAYSIWYGSYCEDNEPASYTFTLCTENEPTNYQAPAGQPKQQCGTDEVPKSTWKEYGRLFAYFPPVGGPAPTPLPSVS